MFGMSSNRLFTLYFCSLQWQLRKNASKYFQQNSIVSCKVKSERHQMRFCRRGIPQMKRSAFRVAHRSASPSFSVTLLFDRTKMKFHESSSPSAPLRCKYSCLTWRFAAVFPLLELKVNKCSACRLHSTHHRPRHYDGMRATAENKSESENDFIADYASRWSMALINNANQESIKFYVSSVVDKQHRILLYFRFSVAWKNCRESRQEAGTDFSPICSRRLLKALWNFY